MQKLQLFTLLSLTTSLATSLLSQAPASAQGFVKIKKDALEQVEFYKAPRHIMILDESPRVTDHRHQINQGNNMVIAIPPLQNGSPAANTITLRPETNNLPQANFASNIPAQGLVANRNLSPVRQGGLTPAVNQDSKHQNTARPLMHKNNAAIKQSSPSQYAPAAYPGYNSGGSFLPSEQNTNTAVTGKLRQQLLQK